MCRRPSGLGTGVDEDVEDQAGQNLKGDAFEPFRQIRCGVEHGPILKNRLQKPPEIGVISNWAAAKTAPDAASCRQSRLSVWVSRVGSGIMVVANLSSN
jgi:hypothetical protein